MKLSGKPEKLEDKYFYYKLSFKGIYWHLAVISFQAFQRLFSVNLRTNEFAHEMSKTQFDIKF